jgi:hypothetical protein
MGSYHAQSHGACPHVLLLLRHGRWTPYLGMPFQLLSDNPGLTITCHYRPIVEEISHHNANRPIRHRSVRRVLRQYVPLCLPCQCVLTNLSILGYNYFASTYFPNMPTLGSCSGTESAASFGCLLLTSYLFLFIDFYVRTYKKAPVAKKTNGVANGNGHINGKAIKFVYPVVFRLWT